MSFFACRTSGKICSFLKDNFRQMCWRDDHSITHCVKLIAHDFNDFANPAVLILNIRARTITQRTQIFGRARISQRRAPPRKVKQQFAEIPGILKPHLAMRSISWLTNFALLVRLRTFQEVEGPSCNNNRRWWNNGTRPEDTKHFNPKMHVGTRIILWCRSMRSTLHQKP